MRMMREMGVLGMMGGGGYLLRRESLLRKRFSV